MVRLSSVYFASGISLGLLRPRYRPQRSAMSSNARKPCFQIRSVGFASTRQAAVSSNHTNLGVQGLEAGGGLPTHAVQIQIEPKATQKQGRPRESARSASAP